MGQDSVKVLYIVGKGRSGSTLLDMVLGQIDGFFSTGELYHLWEWGLLRGYGCGCGKPVPQCELWREVLNVAQRQGDGTESRDALPLPPKESWDPRRLASWKREVFSWTGVSRVLRASRNHPTNWEALRRYSDIASRLYRALAIVTGERVIVDSSKWPVHPGIVGLIPGIRAYVVHLVRDPRAVAYSYQRMKPYPDRGEDDVTPQFSGLHTVASWSARNIVANWVRRKWPVPSLLLRYEDFVNQPREWIERITGLVEEPSGDLSFVDDGRVFLRPTHTVGGNPGRFVEGSLELRGDVEWQTRLSRGRRWLVGGLTSPLLRRYGYPLWAAGPKLDGAGR